MRVPSLTLAVAGAALIAPASLPVPAAAAPPRQAPAPRDEDAVTAADLLARLGRCDQVSRGRFRTDADSRATVPVCGTRDAVYWKADLDIDCDGQATARCNRRADPLFAAMTAFQQSDGRYLKAEKLPYIVVPAPSRRWHPHASGVRGGSVAAVVYRDRVRYAVVGDTGPRDLIGEASYATARALGIPADPRTGGTPSGVTYIVFRDSRVSPVEDHAEAASTGERLARRFVSGK
ncbi:glycoside hydrolase family 75 protein [Streptomyces sp. LP11]|uniref:Glycoside hydrolase family 75 protein n=1 Tax=Streptomyces pyxinicus TaxID=2970331 RepID=A0ABT2B796_9ACTN|nr:glycoside hydrolase family 75 protein [Streptomyces sp. LP11]MCS0603813.1 glycoside hydrolase family 75 protein [Streptomyces sp. LP11]